MFFWVKDPIVWAEESCVMDSDHLHLDVSGCRDKLLVWINYALLIITYWLVEQPWLFIWHHIKDTVPSINYCHLCGCTDPSHLLFCPWPPLETIHTSNTGMIDMRLSFCLLLSKTIVSVLDLNKNNRSWVWKLHIHYYQLLELFHVGCISHPPRMHVTS